MRILQVQIGRLEAAPNARFGSKAEIPRCKRHVCFISESGGPRADELD
jgi:hypothetical protein